MNRRKKGGFAAGCCVALLLITLCAAAGGGVLWYVGRTMAQPGSASMQGASGALGGGAEDAGRQEPLFREGDTVDKMCIRDRISDMQNTAVKPASRASSLFMARYPLPRL